jgi:hypothetical protein
MKFIGRLFLYVMMAYALMQGLCACAPKSYQSMAVMRLDFDDGVCSGTAVARHTIISAAHCFEDVENELGFVTPPPPSMKVAGYPAKILAVVFDGNDHALVKVDLEFDNYLRLAKVPPVGERIHYWGNPAKIDNVYREGYVTSYHLGEMVMDVNGFFGDSGAGVLNWRGQLVGVISFIHPKEHQGLVFSLMGASALEFTPLQYHMMGVAAP